MRAAIGCAMHRTVDTIGPGALRPKRPPGAIAIEWAIAIEAAPIILDREDHDRHADLGAETREGHANALIGIGEQPAVEPAAIALERDIAPAVAVQTPINLDRLAGAEIRHRWIIRRRPCQQRGTRGDKGLIGPRAMSDRERDPDDEDSNDRFHDPILSLFRHHRQVTKRI